MLQCCVHLSVVCLAVMLCIVAKWCVLSKKVIGTKMNDFDLCLEVV